MYHDSFLSPLLTREPKSSKVSKDINPVKLRNQRREFPDQEDFETDEKLLCFYMGLNSSTVLMAVFDMVAAALPENPLVKLTKFQSFTLTLKKMRLNASNFDLAFRFGIMSVEYF